MASVKARNRPKMSPMAQRLAILLDIFSPWEGISLTYRQFAAELGKPVTEQAVKKWPHRTKIPADVARLIVRKAKERGLEGVTLEWLLWGEGPMPRKATMSAAKGAEPAREGLKRAPTQHEPSGRLAAGIAEALQDDLSHNEFGQWSSVEVQHTVIWALKDLARRLRVLRFDMGKTFELTDQWAGKTGLPVRPLERPADERVAT